MATLQADIEATQDRGYAYDSGEFRDRIISFGAAITLPGGQAVEGNGHMLAKY